MKYFIKDFDFDVFYIVLELRFRRPSTIVMLYLYARVLLARLDCYY